MMICKNLLVNSKSLQILFIPSLITNEGDQQIIIHVAILENACFSKRAAVTLLISPTCSLAVSRFARDYNSHLTLAPDATKSVIRL